MPPPLPTYNTPTTQDEVDWDSVWSPTISVENSTETELLGLKRQLSEMKMPAASPSHGIETGKPSSMLPSRKLLPSTSKKSAGRGGAAATAMVARVQEKYHFRCQLSDSMELQSFPFDTQELAIRVGTTGRAQNEIVLQTNPTQKHVTEFDFALAEWNLVKASSEDLLTDPRWSAHKLGYHQVHIKLVVKRKHGYYMFSIVLILFLLGQLVWLTFLINPQDFSDRFNTNLALMLTAITYKSLVDEHLPKMNWLTVRKVHCANSRRHWLGCADSPGVIFLRSRSTFFWGVKLCMLTCAIPMTRDDKGHGLVHPRTARHARGGHCRERRGCHAGQDVARHRGRSSVAMRGG